MCMALVTLTTLIQNARRKADMIGSTFVSDAEVTDYINKSIGELYDILVGAYGEDYFVSSATFTSTGATSYVIASSPVSISNFYKLKGIDINDGGQWMSLRSFMFNERNRRQPTASGSVYDNYRYRIAGDSIHFEQNNPPPTGTQFKVWYIPLPTALSSGSDTFNGQNSWDEYVALDVGIKCLIKEESDTRALENQLRQMDGELELMKEQRDASMAQQVVDMDVVDRYTIF